MCDIRDNEISLEEVEKMDAKWKTFVEFNSIKFSDTLKHAAALSNHAVVMSQYFKRDVRKKTMVNDYLKQSSEIVHKLVSPIIAESRVDFENGGAEITYVLTSEIEKDETQCAAYVVLLQNYITFLRSQSDFGALSRNSMAFIHINLLSRLLGEKELETLALERSLAGLHIMPLSPATFLNEFK